MNNLERVETELLRLLDAADADARQAAETEERNAYSDAMESMERCETAGVVSGLTAALAVVKAAQADERENN